MLPISRICLLFALILVIADIAYSQPEYWLVPGKGTSSDAYAHAIEKVHRIDLGEIIYKGTDLDGHLEVESGLSKDSLGFFFYAKVPSSSIYNSAWFSTPCESTSLEKRCRQQDFSVADTILSEQYIFRIESKLAELSMSLWDEMLIRSKFRPADDIVSTRQYRFEFSKNITRVGEVVVHVKQKKKNSFADRFTQIFIKQARLTLYQNGNFDSDSALVEIQQNSSKLLQEIREYTVESAFDERKVLIPCKEDEHLNGSDFCWRINPIYYNYELVKFIAEKGDDRYNYKLLKQTANSTSELIVQPMAYGTFLVESQMVTRYYSLDPWEITDINAVSWEKDLSVRADTNSVKNGYPLLLIMESFSPLRSDTTIPNEYSDTKWVKLKDLIRFMD